jgi:hypothetical protein
MTTTTYRSVLALSAVDAGYIAGLVDGEGTITLSRKHARRKSAARHQH